MHIRVDILLGLSNYICKTIWQRNAISTSIGHVCQRIYKVMIGRFGHVNKCQHALFLNRLCIPTPLNKQYYFHLRWFLARVKKKCVSKCVELQFTTISWCFRIQISLLYEYAPRAQVLVSLYNISLGFTHDGTESTPFWSCKKILWYQTWCHCIPRRQKSNNARLDWMLRSLRDDLLTAIEYSVVKDNDSFS